jgi:hypothetical protein
MKSTPPIISPIGGIRMSSTKLLTTVAKAAPMTMPTARSMTLPRAMNLRNSSMGGLLFAAMRGQIGFLMIDCAQPSTTLISC